MDNALVKQEDNNQAMWLKPEDHMEQAQEWATSLMSRVDNTFDKKGQPVYYSDLGGNKYLRVDAWEMIGKFAGISAETEWEKELFDADGNIRGYRVKVRLVHKDTGERVGGGAVMQCLMDSNVAKGQYTQDGKENAVLSMAQTRATSKAFRLNFSFVAILGGYDSLPAEEITDEMRAKASKTVQHAESLGAEVTSVKPVVSEVKAQSVITQTISPEPKITTTTPTLEQIPESIVCPVHNDTMAQRSGNYGIYYSHRDEASDKWCNCNYDKPRQTFREAWLKVIRSEHGEAKASEVESQEFGQNISWWMTQLASTTEMCIVCESKADIEISDGVWTCIEHESEYSDN